MRLIRLSAAAVAIGAVAGALAVPAVAAAHHAPPDATVGDPGECGQITIVAAEPAEPHGSYAHAGLVVQVDGEHHVAALGDEVTVGPFTADTVLRWRVWGGGERDYDDPPLADLDALVAWLEDDDSRTPTDRDAPGVVWHEIALNGCPPSPTATAEPTVDPTTDPTAEPTAEPTPAVSESAAPGAGGELAATGMRSGVIVIVGAALVSAGLLLFAVARDRRRYLLYRLTTRT